MAYITCITYLHFDSSRLLHRLYPFSPLARVLRIQVQLLQPLGLLVRLVLDLVEQTELLVHMPLYLHLRLAASLRARMHMRLKVDRTLAR